MFLSVFNGAFLCSSFQFYGNEWFHSQYLYTHSFQFGYYDINCCCCPVGFFMMIICLIGAYVLPGFEGAIFYSIYSRLRFAVDLTNHEKIDMRAVGAYVVPMRQSQYNEFGALMHQYGKCGVVFMFPARFASWLKWTCIFFVSISRGCFWPSKFF